MTLISYTAHPFLAPRPCPRRCPCLRPCRCQRFQLIPPSSLRYLNYRPNSRSTSYRPHRPHWWRSLQTTSITSVAWTTFLLRHAPAQRLLAVMGSDGDG
jgi:hypothetical protein